MIDCSARYCHLWWDSNPCHLQRVSSRQEWPCLAERGSWIGGDSWEVAALRQLGLHRKSCLRTASCLNMSHMVCQDLKWFTKPQYREGILSFVLVKHLEKRNQRWRTCFNNFQCGPVGYLTFCHNYYSLSPGHLKSLHYILKRDTLFWLKNIPLFWWS